MTDDYGPDDPRWEAVHRFLDGLSPLPERREVERWIADDLSVQRYVNAHKKVWSMVARRMGPKPVDPEDAWESLQDRVAEHDRRDRFSLPGRGIEHLRVEDGGLTRGRRRRSPLILAIAGSAAVVVLSLASFMVSTHRKRVASDHVTYALRRGEHPRAARLPDGALVVLAPDSRLEYAVARDGSHVVALEGEASFMVQHRADRTFVVRADGIETRDLGTEFDVRAYRGSMPRVAVRSGRVSIRTQYGTAIIEAGFGASMDTVHRGTSVSQNPPSYFDWTAGRRAFYGESLSEIAAELGRAFDLTIRVDDPTLAAHTVTVTVSTDTPEHALALLAKVAELQYERQGTMVRLFRR